MATLLDMNGILAAFVAGVAFVQVGSGLTLLGRAGREMGLLGQGIPCQLSRPGLLYLGLHSPAPGSSHFPACPLARCGRTSPPSRADLGATGS